MATSPIEAVKSHPLRWGLVITVGLLLAIAGVVVISRANGEQTTVTVALPNGSVKLDNQFTVVGTLHLAPATHGQGANTLPGRYVRLYGNAVSDNLSADPNHPLWSPARRVDGEMPHVRADDDGNGADGTQGWLTEHVEYMGPDGLPAGGLDPITVTVLDATFDGAGHAEARIRYRGKQYLVHELDLNLFVGGIASPKQPVTGG